MARPEVEDRAFACLAAGPGRRHGVGGEPHRPLGLDGPPRRRGPGEPGVRSLGGLIRAGQRRHAGVPWTGLGLRGGRRGFRLFPGPGREGEQGHADDQQQRDHANRHRVEPSLFRCAAFGGRRNPRPLRTVDHRGDGQAGYG